VGYWPKKALYQVTTAPTGEPVDLALLKQHIRVTSTAEDTLLQHYLDTAIEAVERCTNKLTRPAAFTGHYGRFEFLRTEYDIFVKLERFPFRAVTEVRAWDGLQFNVVSTAEYKVEEKSESYTRVLFDDFSDFNLLTVTAEGPEEPYPLQIDFTAGPATAAASNFMLKTAILHYGAWLYDNRGDCDEGDMPDTLRNLIGKQRILDVFA
jgi:uncharacterized phiE125 gp8 family phage protein